MSSYQPFFKINKPSITKKKYIRQRKFHKLRKLLHSLWAQSVHKRKKALVKILAYDTKTIERFANSTEGFVLSGNRVFLFNHHEKSKNKDFQSKAMIMAVITKKLHHVERNTFSHEMMYYLPLDDVNLRSVKPYVLTKSIYDEVLKTNCLVMIPDPMNFICWFEMDNLKEQKLS